MGNLVHTGTSQHERSVRDQEKEGMKKDQFRQSSSRLVFSESDVTSGFACLLLTPCWAAQLRVSEVGVRNASCSLVDSLMFVSEPDEGAQEFPECV